MCIFVTLAIPVATGLHSLPTFLHKQLFVVQLPLQLQCITPCPPTDGIKQAASLLVTLGSDLQLS